MPTRWCSTCRVRPATRGPRCTPCESARDAARRPDFRARYGPGWDKKRAFIVARDPVCTLCGQAPSTTADHIVPLAQGGTSDIENLRGACTRCNSGRPTRWRGKSQEGPNPRAHPQPRAHHSERPL